MPVSVNLPVILSFTTGSTNFFQAPLLNAWQVSEAFYGSSIKHYILATAKLVPGDLNIKTVKPVGLQTDGFQIAISGHQSIVTTMFPNRAVRKVRRILL